MKTIIDLDEISDQQDLELVVSALARLRDFPH
jgi:hypothetical protein